METGLPDTVDTLLFGRDPARAVRLSGVAATLFVLAALTHLLTRWLGPSAVDALAVLTALSVAMFLAAAAGAYLNDGLLVSVALAGGVGLGFYLPVVLFNLGTPGEETLWVLAVGTGTGLGLGVAGFLVGAGAWRLRERLD